MFEQAKKVFERNIKCLSGPQKFLSRPEKYLSAMKKCWRVNLNVTGDIKFIKKFLRYKILNLKCRRIFYPLGQAYSVTHRLVNYYPSQNVWDDQTCGSNKCSIVPDKSQAFDNTYTAGTYDPGKEASIGINMQFNGRSSNFFLFR